MHCSEIHHLIIFLHYIGDPGFCNGSCGQNLSVENKKVRMVVVVVLFCICFDNKILFCKCTLLILRKIYELTSSVNTHLHTLPESMYFSCPALLLWKKFAFGSFYLDAYEVILHYLPEAYVFVS